MSINKNKTIMDNNINNIPLNRICQYALTVQQDIFLILYCTIVYKRSVFYEFR